MLGRHPEADPDPQAPPLEEGHPGTAPVEAEASPGPVSSRVPRALSSHTHPPPRELRPPGAAEGEQPAPFHSHLRLTGAPCPNRPGEGAQPAPPAAQKERPPAWGAVPTMAERGGGSSSLEVTSTARLQPRQRCAEVPRRGGARLPRAAAWGL